MTNRRLLVLDDEPDFAKFVGRVATGIGYEVELTTHGYDFFAAIRRAEPSVILLDMIMPDVDGIEVTKWLADRCSQARIILMTGYDPRHAKIAEHIGTFKMLSVIATLLKPVSVANLTAVLETG